MVLRGTMTTYRKINIDGKNIFYREAGDGRLPALLLLHGFPASSFMFRDLITQLSSDFHVFAPDYPGFGYSDAPDRKSFAYTFDNLGRVTADFVDAVGISDFAIYMQDFGGPVSGLRQSNYGRILLPTTSTGFAKPRSQTRLWSGITRTA
jgi:pimeloyl-ACP methyl ester carboxylesterase